MLTDPLPLPATLPAQPAEAAAPAPEAAALSPAHKLLIDVAELHQLTGISVRQLRRLDSSRDLPGRVQLGRRVLFQTEVIREWVRAGCPDRGQWAALQKRCGRR